MKTLKELCKPRDSVFDVQRRDTVLDLADLAQDKIDPAAFFAENYLALPEFMWLTRQKAVWVHESCVLRGRATAVGIGW